MSTDEREPLMEVLWNGAANILRYHFFVFIIGVVLLGVLLFAALHLPTTYTETTNIEDYGNYSGTGFDSFTRQYISSFFPEAIDASFSNVGYSYKAENLDTYGFEAYLEFTIEDKQQFNEYVAALAGMGEWAEFPFDPGFMECRIEDVLWLDDEVEDQESIYHHQIMRAKIRKILYSPETQTIIYVALGVYDGGGVGTNYLNTFFNRFDLDPLEYAHSTDQSKPVDPYGI